MVELRVLPIKPLSKVGGTAVLIGCLSRKKKTDGLCAIHFPQSSSDSLMTGCQG